MSVFLNTLLTVSVLTLGSNAQAAEGLHLLRKAATRAVNVLPLESGGARGVIQLVFLSELEKKAKLPVCKIFHLVGGTSIGGVIAAGLTLPRNTSIERSKWEPRFSAAELLDEFENKLPTLFQSRFSLWGLLGPKYKSSGPQQVAEHFFGRTTFDQTLVPIMMPAFDLNTSQTVIFKSWKDKSKDLLTADIIKGTGAAPTYFEPHVMNSLPRAGFAPTSYRLVDGAVSANDPAQITVTEAEKLFGRNENHQILSLGTGVINRPYPYYLYKNAGLIVWGIALKDLFLYGQRSLTNYSMQHQYGDRYSRWSPPITIRQHRIDSYDPEVLKHYKQANLEMIDSRRDEFDALVDRLLENTKPL